MDDGVLMMIIEMMMMMMMMMMKKKHGKMAFVILGLCVTCNRVAKSGKDLSLALKNSKKAKA